MKSIHTYQVIAYVYGTGDNPRSDCRTMALTVKARSTHLARRLALTRIHERDQFVFSMELAK